MCFSENLGLEKVGNFSWYTVTLQSEILNCKYNLVEYRLSTNQQKNHSSFRHKIYIRQEPSSNLIQMIQMKVI